MKIQHTNGSVLTRPLGNRCAIGRLSTSDLVLDSEQVSRKHAELIKDPMGRWWIRDLNSRNGTRVNGQMVKERMLVGGDSIHIGEYSLQLVGAGTPSSVASQQPPPESTTDLPVDDDAEGGRLSSLLEMPPPVIRASHLSRLVHFGQDLAQTGERVGRMNLLCELMTGGGFPGRFAMVLRIDKSGSSAPRILAQSAGAASAGAPPPHISRTMLKFIREREQPVLASNVPGRQADVQLSIAADQMFSAAVACPIRKGENDLDVLYVILPPEVGTAEWLAVASLAGEQFEQSEADWQRREQLSAYVSMQRDLEQARDLQRRLLPHDVSIPGWDWAVRFAACQWVGGDYVDVIQMADGNVALTIADVCGHGLDAALMASSLHSVLSATLTGGAQLDKTVTDLNSYLCRVLPSDRFATMMCIVIDPATGKCRAVNAGHPPAFVISQDGSHRALKCGDYAPLGVFPETKFTSEEDELRKGDMLALYTDGLMEVTAADGELLGHKRLGESLAQMRTLGATTPKQLADQLFDLIAKLQGDAWAQDDRAILVAGPV